MDAIPEKMGAYGMSGKIILNIIIVSILYKLP
jgi:hypothetical protein